jgi:hypothetical protein
MQQREVHVTRHRPILAETGLTSGESRAWMIGAAGRRASQPRPRQDDS